MNRVIACLTLLLLVVATESSAQVLVPVNKAQPAPHPTSGTMRAERIAPGAPTNQPEAESVFPVALTEAGLAVGSSGPQLSLQAVNLFLAPTVHFYLRSTLPVTTGAASDPTKNAATAKTPDAIAAALLDPSGGVLNAQFGYYGKLRRSRTAGNDDQTLEAANHGVFLDARLGGKILEVVDKTASAEVNGKAFPMTALASGMLSLKGVFRLWQGSDVSTPSVGGVLVALNLNGNYAADRTYNSLLGTNLRRATAAVSVTFAFTLNDIGYIVVDGTLKTNQAQLGRRLIVSFNVAKLSPKTVARSK